MLTPPNSIDRKAVAESATTCKGGIRCYQNAMMNTPYRNTLGQKPRLLPYSKVTETRGRDPCHVEGRYSRPVLMCSRPKGITTVADAMRPIRQRPTVML